MLVLSYVILFKHLEKCNGNRFIGLYVERAQLQRKSSENHGFKPKFKILPSSVFITSLPCVGHLFTSLKSIKPAPSKIIWKKSVFILYIHLCKRCRLVCCSTFPFTSYSFEHFSSDINVAYHAQGVVSDVLGSLKKTKISIDI